MCCEIAKRFFRWLGATGNNSNVRFRGCSIVVVSPQRMAAICPYCQNVRAAALVTLRLKAAPLQDEPRSVRLTFGGLQFYRS